MSKRNFFVALGLLPFFIGIIGFIGLSRAPYLELEYESRGGKWYFAGAESLAPEQAEALKGREIMAIAGFRLEVYDLAEDFDYIPEWKPLEHWWKAQRHFAAAIKAGQPVTLTLGAAPEEAEGGGESEITVTPRSFTAAEALMRAAPLYFIAALSMLLGLVIIYKRPDDRKAVAFFMLVFTSSLILFTFGSYIARNVSLDPSLFMLLRVVNGIGFSFMPVTFLYFALVFPRPTRLARSGAAVTILFLLPVAVAAVYQPRWSYMSLQYLFLGGLLGGIAMLIYSYRTVKSAEERAQVKWVIWGTGLFGAIFSVTTFFPILFSGERLVGDTVPSLFFPLIPLTMAFAIARYRLLDIDSLIENTIVYFAVLAGLVGVETGVMMFLASNDVMTFSTISSATFSTMVVIFVYVPFRNAIKQGIRKLLRRERYELSEVTLRLNVRLIAAHGMEDAIRTGLDIINEALSPRRGAALLFGGGSPSVVAGWGEGGQADVQTFAGLLGGIDRSQAADDVPWLAMPGYAGGVAIPVKSEAGNMGVFVLGEKCSGRLYNRDDLRLLETVAGQTALALKSLMNREEAEQRERESMLEKERISREIHDGMGGILANINLLSVNAMDVKLNTDRERTLSAIFALSKEGISEIRQLMQGLDDRDITWNSFAADLKHHAANILEPHGIFLDFKMSVEIPDESPRLFLWLNILRIYKEALTNITKHSQAKKVNIEFNVYDDKCEINIYDDGIGFEGGDGKGRGLSNMKTRAREMGGQLIVDSGRGTALFLSIPTKYHEVGIEPKA